MLFILYLLLRQYPLQFQQPPLLQPLCFCTAWWCEHPFWIAHELLFFLYQCCNLNIKVSKFDIYNLSKWDIKIVIGRHKMRWLPVITTVLSLSIAGLLLPFSGPLKWHLKTNNKMMKNTIVIMMPIAIHIPRSKFLSSYPSSQL